MPVLAHSRLRTQRFQRLPFGTDLFLLDFTSRLTVDVATPIALPMDAKLSPSSSPRWMRTRSFMSMCFLFFSGMAASFLRPGSR